MPQTILNTHRSLISDLVVGCHVLAEQEILDGYGHQSIRVPGNDKLFIISRVMSPALVTESDFIVQDLEGRVVDGMGHPNTEWPIHASIYRSRPDVISVVHSHSKISRVFSLSQMKLRGLITSSAPEWQKGIPVYRQPGLVSTMDRGGALASVLAQANAILLRGHGDVVVGSSVADAAMRSINLKINAEILQGLIVHGLDIDLWTEEELEVWKGPQRGAPTADTGAVNRAWDYYVARVDGRLARLLNTG